MRKRFEHPGHAHYLTFSCYKNYRLFDCEDLNGLFIEHLDLARKRRKFELYAFVIMPNHVHLLLKPAIDDNISKVMLSIKKTFSYEALKSIDATNPALSNQLKVYQKGQEIRRFWQAGGGYDRNILSIEAMQKTIDYIHMNPVRKNLVRDAVEWQWSSARYWIHNVPEPLKMDIPELI